MRALHIEKDAPWLVIMALDHLMIRGRTGVMHLTGTKDWLLHGGEVRAARGLVRLATREQASLKRRSDGRICGR